MFGSPCVMNQKIAPSDALCVGPLASAGMLPVPPPVGPWQAAQCRANRFAPACAPARLPAYGFFVCSAAAGASWKEVFWALTGKQAPIAASRSTDASCNKTRTVVFRLPRIDGVQDSSQPMVDISCACDVLVLPPALPTRTILHCHSSRNKKAAASVRFGLRVTAK